MASSCYVMNEEGFPVRYSYWYHSNYRFVDSLGNLHSFLGLEISTVQEACGSLATTVSRTASDGSGYTLTLTNYPGSGIGYTVTSPDGTKLGFTDSSATDRNGNRISYTGDAFGNGTYKDTLNTTALTVATTSSAGAKTVTYSYPGPDGNPASYVATYSAKNVLTAFNCTGVNEYSAQNVLFIDALNLPDGSSYQFTYEKTNPGAATITGRLASVKLPTGGVVAYEYTGSNKGISCTDGTTNGLDRSLDAAKWVYTRNGTATNVTDPESNLTTVTFTDGLETNRSISGGGGVLRSIQTCYNGNCSTTPSFPINQIDVFTTLPSDSGGKVSRSITKYNTMGLPTEISEYDFGTEGSTVAGPLLRRRTISYSGSTNHPWVIATYDGSGTLKAKVTYTYDEGSVTPTTVLMHTSVTGPRWNPTTVSSYVDSGRSLTRTFDYYDTGVVKTATDANGATTTYTYGDCNGAFATKVDSFLSGLSQSYTWNCNGGVIASAKDPNNAETTYAYDSMFRPASSTDPATVQTIYSYDINPTQSTVQSALTFNAGQSTVKSLQASDRFGRVQLTQVGELPTGYSLVETDYDSFGLPVRVTLPFSASSLATSATAPGTSTTYDALGRVRTITDSGGGSTTTSYTLNAALSTVGPAPSNEKTKARQNEYDALGRLTSVCEITSGQYSGACGQAVAQTGYLTQYTYDVLGNITQVKQNAQPGGTVQTRTYVYDGLGRLTSETNPEQTKATVYVYDSVSDGTCNSSSAGDLVKTVDAMDNVTCYSYDALHRVTAVTYSGPYAPRTPNKTFVYDAAIVNGVAMNNAKGRLAEAYTGGSSAKITDTGFSYTVRGEVSDVYQKTPNSSGFYHVSASNWEHGIVRQLSGLPGLPTITYGLDSEGRVNGVTSSSGQNPVTNVIYNIAGAPSTVTFGSGDVDTFSYDPNTNRPTKFQYSINGQLVQRTLAWNPNGTLESQAVVDPFNSLINGKSCSYSYDDLSRVSGVNCGSLWQQTFGFDPFGNLSKSGSISFLPTLPSTSNRINGVGVSYDSSGNVTNDNVRTYEWTADGKEASVDGVNVTYDALGRTVEIGGNTQIVYGPDGSKLAVMNGQTLKTGFIALPGGATAVYNSSGLAYFRHSDWLGSSQFASTAAAPTTMHSSKLFAPYGEPIGEAGAVDRSFALHDQDTVQGIHDAPFRRYNPVHGRWLSPDPGGLATVDPANPQTWNGYAYTANNPVNAVDPSGLEFIWISNCLYHYEYGIVYDSDPSVIGLVNARLIYCDYSGNHRNTPYLDPIAGPASNWPATHSASGGNGSKQPANTGTISATHGYEGSKKQLCDQQSNKAFVEEILPGGSVLLGGNYRPTNVMKETAKEGGEVLVDLGAESNTFMRLLKSKWGVPASLTSRVLTTVGYVFTAIDVLKATKAMQKEYKQCMEW
jgi:RHS repeat-associated protein